MSPARPVDIAILAFPAISGSVVYGLHDLFWSAGRDWGLVVDGRPGPNPLRARVVTVDGTPLAIGNGVRLVPHGACGDAMPDLVCVPDVSIPPGEPFDGLFDREVAWLRACHAAGATLASACSGSLLFAEAGLLDGHDATTHWAYCDVMRARYPNVTVRGRRALVVSGEGQRLVMGGGGTSWLDLGLYLIARFAGIETAMQAARINLIDWHAIGQQPFARLSCSRQVDDAAISRSQAWLADHYRERAPVAAMARVSGLPERSFKRRFQQATGLAPLEYVHTLRLEEAKHLLETTGDSVESIAGTVGYEDAAFFGRLFRRNVDLTPGQYRKRFGAMRRAITDAAADAGERDGRVAGRGADVAAGRAADGHDGARPAAAGTGG